MSISAEGEDFRTFTISDIIPLTPADQSNLKVGDEILKINNMKMKNKSLNDIIILLNNTRNTDLLFTIKRENEIIKINVHLFNIL